MSSYRRYGLSLLLMALPSAALAQAGLNEEQPEEQEITKLPAITKDVQADYPPAALKQRVEAEVQLEIDITEEGKVEEITPVRTSTWAELRGEDAWWPEPARPGPFPAAPFVRAATTAVSLMEFSPAMAGDEPVRVRIGYAYRFELPRPEPPTQDIPPPQAGQGEANFIGLIRERGNRKLLPGVLVTVFRGQGEAQQGFEATTDENGRFVFYGLPPGDWKLLAESEGYFPIRTTEQVKEGERLEAVYYLERGAYSEYDVEVRDTRVKKEVTRRTLTRAEILSVPGTLGDPIRVVSNLPGVARTASGVLVIRGSSPRDSGIFVDGVRLPLVYHFGALRSVIPGETVEQVDFYPGNFGLRYGRITGGVVDVKMRELHPDQFHGSLDISLLDTSVFLQAPITDTLSVAIAGRRSYIDYIIEAAVPSDADVGVVSAPRYYDYQLMLSWRPSSSHTVRATFIGSDDTMELLFNNPADQSLELQATGFSADTSFYRGWVEYNYTPGERFRNKLLVAFGPDHVNFQLGDMFSFDVELMTYQLRELAELQVNKMLKLGAGLDVLARRYNLKVLAPDFNREGEGDTITDISDTTYTESNGIQNTMIAPFIETEIKLLDGRLNLQPGLRLDYVGINESWTLDPRIVVRYKLSDQWTVKGGVARVMQRPREEDVDENFGNPDIDVARATQYSLGAEYSPLEYLNFDVALFYKDLTDMVVSSDRMVERDGETVALNVDNDGRGRVYGLELFLEHKFHNNIRGWLSYTLSRSERKDGPDEDWRLFDWDQTHILTLVASYSLPHNWEVGIRWRYVSGSPSTPYSGSVYNADSDSYQPIQGETNSERLPAFHQLDLRIDKRWIWDMWTLNAYLSLLNAYNRRNPEGWSYDFDYSHREITQGLPILPIIGLKGTW